MADSRKLRVAMMGSGNWGSVAAKLVATNTARLSDKYHAEVRMWVFQEQFEGRNLTDVINERHENPKYLKGVPLPHNLVADPDVAHAAEDADVLVFCIPHQFLKRPIAAIKPGVKKDVKVISLIKGCDFDSNGIVLVSQAISEELGGVNVSVLCGANIADEVGAEKFAETTIGYYDKEDGELFQELFNTPAFRVNITDDPIGVELCGALKNVVALGAGFCDGLGQGNNTKAAIMRIGLNEMKLFTEEFFPGAGKLPTYFESCGLADLITTCYGGRNRKCADAFAKGGKSWEELEKEHLGGQKLQGTLTSKEVTKAIRNRRLEARFPLFEAVHKISFEGVPAARLFDLI